jgi:hypothetical protein
MIRKLYRVDISGNYLNIHAIPYGAAIFFTVCSSFVLNCHKLDLRETSILLPLDISLRIDGDISVGLCNRFHRKLTLVPVYLCREASDIPSSEQDSVVHRMSSFEQQKVVLLIFTKLSTFVTQLHTDTECLREHSVLEIEPNNSEVR